MKLKSFVLASGLAVMGAYGAQASAQVELDFSHWVSATGHPMGQAFANWAQSISTASNGRIKINIFDNAQLGVANDHFDMVNRGLVDIAFFNSGYVANVFPIISLGELPFLFANAPDGSRAFHEWFQQYAAIEMPNLYVCMAHIHDPGTIHGDVPILLPTDFAGKVVRQANATMGLLVRSLGGTTIGGSPAEMANQLITGAADLTSSPWGSLFTWNAQNVATHHLDMAFYSANFVVGINRASYNRLSAADRAVIDAHCNPEWSSRIVQLWTESESSGRQRIIDLGGHTLYTPTAAQTQQWKDAAAFLLDDWKARVRARYPTLNPDEIYDSFIASLRKYDALLQ